jgi:hypothetical protein
MGNAAWRGDRQCVCTAEGLRSGGGRVDLQVFVRRGNGACTDHQADDKCQMLGRGGHDGRPFVISRASCIAEGFYKLMSGFAVRSAFKCRFTAIFFSNLHFLAYEFYVMSENLHYIAIKAHLTGNNVH